MMLPSLFVIMQANYRSSSTLQSKQITTKHAQSVLQTALFASAGKKWKIVAKFWKKCLWQQPTTPSARSRYFGNNNMLVFLVLSRIMHIWPMWSPKRSTSTNTIATLEKWQRRREDCAHHCHDSLSLKLFSSQPDEDHSELRHFLEDEGKLHN